MSTFPACVHRSSTKQTLAASVLRVPTQDAFRLSIELRITCFLAAFNRSFLHTRSANSEASELSDHLQHSSGKHGLKIHDHHRLSSLSDHRSMMGPSHSVHRIDIQGFIDNGCLDASPHTGGRPLPSKSVTDGCIELF